MKITYFHRHPSCGFSIQRVFKTLQQEIGKTLGYEEFFMPSAHSMPWDICRNNWFCFRHRKKSAVHHISGHVHEVILGLIGCKTILTVHDLVFLDNVTNPFKRFYKWLFWLYVPIKLSHRVVCISTQTKNNILKHLATDKLVVIPNAVDPIFTHTPKEFNSAKPTILHIGTGWNKNLQKVVHALKGIPCHLRIIGKLSKKQEDILKRSTLEYSNATKLSDAQIQQEYVHCDMVSFPSVYEGFGMPIIEGQATGRAVLTSKIEPLMEVSGDAVTYVNPEDTDSIREGFKRLITENTYRESIINKGLENVKRFQVKKIAEAYIEVYKNC